MFGSEQPPPWVTLRCADVELAVWQATGAAYLVEGGAVGEDPFWRPGDGPFRLPDLEAR